VVSTRTVLQDLLGLAAKVVYEVTYEVAFLAVVLTSLQDFMISLAVLALFFCLQQKLNPWADLSEKITF